jgi:RimJ/RimL family protein N-acetyltransferase
MEIANSTLEDIDEIFKLYKLATDFQKTKFTHHWPEFDKLLVETEILENRQWKIIIDDEIACVWATTFDDPQIWGELNNDPSTYIHRIATNPKFRGRDFVKEIIKWSIAYSKDNEKLYVRMDTVGNNLNLINYYKKCGFDFIGLLKLTDTSELPAHYHEATVSLFQIKL